MGMVENLLPTITVILLYFVHSYRLRQRFKRERREMKKEFQQMLWQDRQIRRGNVGTFGGSNSGGNGSSSSS